MELNEMEKRLLFQVEGDYQYKVLNELHIPVAITSEKQSRKKMQKVVK